MPIIQDHNVTAINGQFDIYRNEDPQMMSVDTIIVTGSARRNPVDRNDPEIGLLLAQARMYQKVANRLFREARGRVKHADDMALDRQRKREAKQG